MPSHLNYLTLSYFAVPRASIRHTQDTISPNSSEITLSFIPFTNTYWQFISIFNILHYSFITSKITLSICIYIYIYHSYKISILHYLLQYSSFGLPFPPLQTTSSLTHHLAAVLGSCSVRDICSLLSFGEWWSQFSKLEEKLAQHICDIVIVMKVLVSVRVHHCSILITYIGV